MIKPCKDCPFRSDIKFVLSKDRANQIAKNVIQGDEAFHCHKTISWIDTTPIWTNNEKPCIGAIKAIKKERGDAKANLWVRLMSHLKRIDLDLIDENTPVHNAQEFIKNVSGK